MISLPKGVSKDQLLKDLKEIAWKAHNIFTYYTNILKTSEKSKADFLGDVDFNDPVTKADIEVNKLVINEIKRKYPDCQWNFLSEEDVKKAKSIKFSSPWTWIIDPLDGTKDFLQGTGEFALHIALVYENNPILGIVLLPSKDELWISVNGEETWCENKSSNQTKSCANKYFDLREMTILTSRNHVSEDLKTLIKHVGFKNQIKMGSIGFKFVALAKGVADIYLTISLKEQSSPKDWDFAAPEAILNGSGGVISKIDGSKINYLQNEFRQDGIIVASSNKKSHKRICDEILEIIKDKKLFNY